MKGKSRLQRLLKEREQLDAAIAQAKRGEIDPPDETRLRERLLRLPEVVDSCRLIFAK